jgi:hypothetical protein
MMRKIFGTMLATVCFCSSLNAEIILEVQDCELRPNENKNSLRFIVKNTGPRPVNIVAEFSAKNSDGTSNTIDPDECSVVITSMPLILSPNSSDFIIVTYIPGASSKNETLILNVKGGAHSASSEVKVKAGGAARVASPQPKKSQTNTVSHLAQLPAKGPLG